MIGILGGASAWLIGKGIGKPIQLVILIVFVLGAVGVVVAKIRSDAKAKALMQKNIEDLDEREDARRVQAARFAETIQRQEKIIAESEERERAYQEQAREFRAMVERQNQVIASIQSQRAQLHAEIDRLPDSELAPRIKEAIGLRRPEDYGRAGFIPEEERAILICLQDKPLCAKENAALADKIKSMDGEIAAIRGELGEVRVQLGAEKDARAATDVFLDQMMGHYKAAQDALPRTKRSAKCLFLWKCAERKLEIPTLDEILEARP